MSPCLQNQLASMPESTRKPMAALCVWREFKPAGWLTSRASHIDVAATSLAGLRLDFGRAPDGIGNSIEVTPD